MVRDVIARSEATKQSRRAASHRWRFGIQLLLRWPVRLVGLRDRAPRWAAIECGPTAGVMPPVAACRAGRVRTDAVSFGVGSESAAGVALSQKLSSADFTSLSAEKYTSCQVSSAARKCQALFLSAFNQ